MHADKPTLLTLLRFPPNCLSPHCINIASRIGKDYWKFGLFLLEDEDGHTVDAVTYSYHHDGIEMMTLKIFQKWLEGEGRTPVSWNTLVQVLYNVQLNQLAGEVQKYTQPNS